MSENIRYIKYDQNQIGNEMNQQNGGLMMNNMNLNNFNSQTSGINREIPKETKQIVDDLFDDSMMPSKRDQSFDFSILEKSKKDIIDQTPRQNNLNIISPNPNQNFNESNKIDMNFSIFHNNSLENNQNNHNEDLQFQPDLENKINIENRDQGDQNILNSSHSSYLKESEKAKNVSILDTGRVKDVSITSRTFTNEINKDTVDPDKIRLNLNSDTNQINEDKFKSVMNFHVDNNINPSANIIDEKKFNSVMNFRVENNINTSANFIDEKKFTSGMTSNRPVENNLNSLNGNFNLNNQNNIQNNQVNKNSSIIDNSINSNNDIVKNKSNLMTLNPNTDFIKNSSIVENKLNIVNVPVIENNYKNENKIISNPPSIIEPSLPENNLNFQNENKFNSVNPQSIENNLGFNTNSFENKFNSVNPKLNTNNINNSVLDNRISNNAPPSYSNILINENIPKIPDNKIENKSNIVIPIINENNSSNIKKENFFDNWDSGFEFDNIKQEPEQKLYSQKQEAFKMNDNSKLNMSRQSKKEIVMLNNNNSVKNNNILVKEITKIEAVPVKDKIETKLYNNIPISNDNLNDKINSKRFLSKNSSSKNENVMEQNKGINFDEIFNNLNLNDNSQNEEKIIKVKNSQIQNDFNYAKNINSNNINEYEYKEDDFINLREFSSNNQPNKFNQYFDLEQFNENQEPIGKLFNVNLALDYDKIYGKSKIAKESSEDIQNRKTRIVNDNEFSYIRSMSNILLENGINLKSYMNLEEESLNIQVQVIFEDMLLNSTDTEKIKKELDRFKLNQIVNISPIGYLNPIEKVYSHSGCPSSLNCFKEMGREVNGLRNIINDGNSFLRSFMFALIENCIFNKNVFQLKKILYDINVRFNTTFKRKDIIINKNLVNTIFYFLIDYIENNRIREANDFLIKSYHRFQNFDLSMIKYMRLAIGQYLLENQNVFTLNLNDILPTQYITKDGFNLKSYLEDSLYSMNMEAEKIVIFISPIVFNINLDLFVIEGINDNSGVKIPIFFKQNFPCLLGVNKMNNFSSTISIFHKLAHYDIIYTNKNIEDYSQIITFSYNDMKEIQDINIQRITVLAELTCDVCNRKSDLLTFTHIPGMPICKMCVIDFVKKVILLRTKFYSEEMYRNLEYYCRPIVVDPQSNHMLFDDDILQLVDMTIPQLFLMFLDQVCLFCQNSLEGLQSFVMPCECRICATCCEKRINLATNGRVILNNFERMYSSIKKPNCACGIPFDVEYAITLTIKNIDVYIAQAKDRLIHTALQYCIMCRQNLWKKDQRGIPGIHDKLPVVDELENSSNVVYTPHVICKNCVLTMKGDLMRMSKSGNLNNQTKSFPIKCSVCIKKTHLIELKYAKLLIKSEDGSCCTIL